MLVSGVVLGAIVGFAVGRDWTQLARLHVVWLPLLGVALLLRAMSQLVFDSLALYILAIAGTATVAAMNWRLPGSLLVAVGSLLNLLVIVVNGGMPVDVAALGAIDGRMPRDALHVVASDRTTLLAFSDVIMIAPLRGGYSVGDVLVAAGAFLVTFITLARR